MNVIQNQVSQSVMIRTPQTPCKKTAVITSRGCPVLLRPWLRSSVEFDEPSDGSVRSERTTKEVHRTSSRLLPGTSICARLANSTPPPKKQTDENGGKILCQRRRMTEEEEGENPVNWKAKFWSGGWSAEPGGRLLVLSAHYNAGVFWC